MSSNNCDYTRKYHQQNSTQQYSSYQTAPPTNASATSSRHYPQAHSAAPTQSTDYSSYSGPSYGAASTGHGAAQHDTWSGGSSNYGSSRDSGSRAAEVLSNMSHTGYVTTTTAPSQYGFTATNSASAHHSPGRPLQLQAQPSQVPHSTYGQTQAPPRTINTNQAQPTTAAYPSQRALQFSGQETHQRTASPTQQLYGQSNAAAGSRNGSMATAGSSQQYSDYNHRHTSDVNPSRSSHVVTPSNSYTPLPPAPIVHPPVSSMSEPYTGSGTTVDPTAVYDPWPEYQRQQGIRDAERAEKEKKEEAARKEKLRSEEEERKRIEAEEEARQAQLTAKQPKARAKNAQKQKTPAPAAVPTETSGSSAAPDIEAEIRSMMARMRELNGKDPQLLARIWEEERRTKAPSTKSPTLTTKSNPQPAINPPAQVPTPPTANQRKKAIPRGPSSMPIAKPVTLAQAGPTRLSTATPARTAGTTIWPPEKRLELAKAAASYLSTKNPTNQLMSDQILQMLDGNPSYIELCEQLEQTGFGLDRSTFAKTLLLAVPDVNSASRQQSGPAPVSRPPAQPAVIKYPAPPAVMKNSVATPVAPTLRYAPAAMDNSRFPPFPDDDALATPSAVPVAEMIPIKPELKPPANKEEAARKRNLSDLVDLTQLDDEEDMGPPLKKFNANTYISPYTQGTGITTPPANNFSMAGDSAPIRNFPTASTSALLMNDPTPGAAPVPMPATELRYRAIVEPLDKKKALRRNSYNPATIARDVLLACGRHPSERQLNQHLDILKVNFPQISNDSDLSTIKWGLIDPGLPPPDYFKDSVQALTENLDEDDSEDDKDQAAHWGSLSHMESARVQALPEATNPFMKQKRRGRQPRHSFPNTITTPSTPEQQTSSASMSSTAQRPASAGVGYSAFREYGPDGNPLPKKKGRPVGWRKAIHGSAAAQQRPAMFGQTSQYQPQQPSSLRNAGAGEEPIRIDSRSPSVANHAPHYQPFKCKWQNCKASLHNLDTLKLHVLKIHKKETLRKTLECLWEDCGKEVTSHDPMSNMSLERHVPHAFGTENAWREHIQQNHFDPLAWEQGDGPAGGLSDAHESEAYLSDAQGRRVTPRITASPAEYESVASSPQLLHRVHGRPAKNAQEQDARDTQDRLVSQKRRMGGPGMDRGGATLVNGKRRRGLIDSDGTEEKYVDAED